jgi:putative nucleotidyltransferase with HDIG domain
MMAIPGDIVAAVDRIPPLAQGVGKLLAMLSNGESSATGVAEIVAVDPALTARVLRLVNSAAFGLRVQVESVSRAVAYLGDRTVASIALESTTGELYHAPLVGYLAEPDALWRHCLYTAIGARELANYATTEVSPDVAYTAGLLHDIGKVVIDAWLVRRATEIVAEADTVTPDFDENERKHLYTDHAEVGGAVLAHWGLSATLQQAVALHHCPERAPKRMQDLVYVVHLADFLAMMGGAGTGIDTLKYRLDDNYSSSIVINADELDRVSCSISDEYQKVIMAMEGEAIHNQGG